MTKICMAGAAGRMGRRILELATAENDIAIGGAFDLPALAGTPLTVGVEVAAGVGVVPGVRVQPGGMVGRFGRTEQPARETTSQSPRRRRIDFIPFLYWQKTDASSKVRA